MAASTETKENQVIEKQIKTVNFVTGLKGGVGKTIFAKLLYEYHIDNDIPVIGVDADPGNPDFSSHYPEIREAENMVDFSIEEDQDDIDNVNLIYYLAEESQKNIVVNMSANCAKGFSLWIEIRSIIETIKEIDFTLVNWFVTSGEDSSKELLKFSLNSLGAEIPHIVVRNRYFKDWEDFEEDTEIQDLIGKFEVTVIDLPRLPKKNLKIMQENRLSYKATRELSFSGYSAPDRANVKVFLGKGYKAIESTPFFGDK